MTNADAIMVSLLVGLLVSFCIGQMGLISKEYKLIAVSSYAFFMGIMSTVIAMLSIMILVIS